MSVLKEFKEIKKKYHINVLVSANTFYLLLIMIPLVEIGFDFDQFKGLNILNILSFGFIVIINLLFVASKYLNSLRLTSDIIYTSYPLRSKWKEGIKSFILTLFIIVIILVQTIISFGMFNVWKALIGSYNFVFLKIIELIFSLLSVLFISTLIFKYSIPAKVSFKESFKVSIILTLIWIFFSTTYQIFYNIIENVIFIGKMVFLTYWLYILNYLIIIIFIYHYLKVKKWQKNKE